MSTIHIGPKVPFGIVEPLPLRGFPDGKARIRIRQGEYALVRIKTPDGIREFYPGEESGEWIPRFERGKNCTPAS